MVLAHFTFRYARVATNPVSILIFAWENLRFLHKPSDVGTWVPAQEFRT